MDESVDLLSAARRQQINLPSPPSSLHRGPTYTHIHRSTTPFTPFHLFSSCSSRLVLFPLPRPESDSILVHVSSRFSLRSVARPPLLISLFRNVLSFSRVLEGNICRLSFHIPPPAVEGLHKRLYALCGTETPPRRRGGKSATRLLLWIFVPDGTVIGAKFEYWFYCFWMLWVIYKKENDEINSFYERFS